MEMPPEPIDEEVNKLLEAEAEEEAEWLAQVEHLRNQATRCLKMVEDLHDWEIERDPNLACVSLFANFILLYTDSES